VLDIITWSTANNSVHNCWGKYHHKHACPEDKGSFPSIGPTLFCRNPIQREITATGESRKQKPEGIFEKEDSEIKKVLEFKYAI
jgi:hypothetical protein